MFHYILVSIVPPWNERKLREKTCLISSFFRLCRRQGGENKQGKRRKTLSQPKKKKRRKKNFFHEIAIVTSGKFQQLLLWKKFLCFLHKTLALLDGRNFHSPRLYRPVSVTAFHHLLCKVLLKQLFLAWNWKWNCWLVFTVIGGAAVECWVKIIEAFRVAFNQFEIGGKQIAMLIKDQNFRQLTAWKILSSGCRNKILIRVAHSWNPKFLTNSIPSQIPLMSWKLATILIHLNSIIDLLKHFIQQTSPFMFSETSTIKVQNIFTGKLCRVEWFVRNSSLK